MESAHLVVGGNRVTSVSVATTRRERGRGLLGRDGFDGALALVGVRSVHTIGMRFTIDVAYARWVQPEEAGAEPMTASILEIVAMKPNRIGRFRRCDLVLEAERGAFASWGIGPESEVVIDAEGGGIQHGR